MTDLRSRLGNRRLLATNVLWNLAAQVLPAIVGVIAVPFIIRGLGIERFGVLTLAWMVIGYFSLFDLGLGRAVTKLAAEMLPLPHRPGLNDAVWTAWYLMGAVGIISAILLTAVAPWLVHDAVKVPVPLQHETLVTFYLLAWAVPVVVLTTGFRGLLEADQRFALVSSVRAATGLATFLVPVAVLQFTVQLPVIIVVLMVVRLAGGVAYATMCYRVVPELTRPAPINPQTARRLFRFGAWMTVSNVVSPLMDSIDRFLIGALVSVAAVAYYATPFDTVTKLLIISSSVAAVLFPAFSAASVTDQSRMAELFRTGVGSVFAALFPTALVVIAFAPDLLQLWLGRGFARESGLVLRILMLGVLANGLAAVPFSFIQGLGRADLTGKLHLLEALLYFPLLVWLVKAHGINGAAVAWTSRVSLDMAGLSWLAARQSPKEPLFPKGMAIPLALVPLLGLGWLPLPVIGKGAMVGLLLAAVAVLLQRHLAPPARSLIRLMVTRLRT